MPKNPDFPPPPPEQSADFKTAKIISAPPPPRRKKPSPEASPVEVAQQIQELKASIGVEGGEDKEKREKLIQQVLQDGGFTLKTHINYSYINKGTHGGFHTFADEKSKPRLGEKSTNDNPIQLIQNQLGVTDLADSRNSLARLGIDELIDIRPEEKITQKKVVVHGNKGNIFGWGRTEDTFKYEEGERVPRLHSEMVVGGKKEPAVRFTYITRRFGKDVFGRQGKVLDFCAVLSESVAREFEKQIDKDPSIMRDVLERVAKQKFLKNPNDWEKPMTEENAAIAGKEGSPIRPPFEEFSHKAYVQKAESSSGKKGTIRQIKK